MDLAVEVDLSENGLKSKHALLIEDKYYSGIRYDGNLQEYQIQTYKRIFDNFYSNEQAIRHYWVISCISPSDEKFKYLYGDVNLYGFKAISIYDLVQDVKEDSESDIFNQFFLRDWC